MKFFDRLLTIIITATLTSAFWIVFGNTIFEMAEGESAEEPERVEATEPLEASSSSAPSAGPSTGPSPAPSPQIAPPPTRSATPASVPMAPASDVPQVIAPNIVPSAPATKSPDDREGGA